MEPWLIFAERWKPRLGKRDGHAAWPDSGSADGQLRPVGDQKAIEFR